MSNIWRIFLEVRQYHEYLTNISRGQAIPHEYLTTTGSGLFWREFRPHGSSRIPSRSKVWTLLITVHSWKPWMQLPTQYKIKSVMFSQLPVCGWVAGLLEKLELREYIILLTFQISVVEFEENIWPICKRSRRDHQHWQHPHHLQSDEHQGDR